MEYYAFQNRIVSGDMDRLTSMKIFVRIIQLGSFTAVALEMGMTQSSVSKKMSALETRLGATLLTRNNRQILLTEVVVCYFLILGFK